MSNQNVTGLIVSLLSLAAEYGAQLVKDIAELIHQNPGATMDEINAKITAALNAAADNDAAVEES